MTPRETLEAANIVHLVPAARMAGFRFRNGLTKAQIIDGLVSAGPSMVEAAVRALAVARGQATPLSAPTPASEWLPPEEKPAEPSPLPGGWLPWDGRDHSGPKVEMLYAVRVRNGKEYSAIFYPRNWRWHHKGDGYDIVAYKSRDAESTAPSISERIAQTPPPAAQINLSEYAKREWVRGEVLAAEGRVSKRCDSLDAAVKLLQDSRPIELHLPEKPEPLKLTGTVHPQFPDLLLALRAGLHCMLVGPAGSGKTYSAEDAANKLGVKFYAQGAVTYAHELLGYIDAHSRYVRTQFRDAFEHGGIILLDEFDASSPEAALVVNAGLANGFCAFPDGMVRKHEGFICIVGANTDGSGATMSYSGRARLDGAFLDRFIVFRWDVDARIESDLSAGNAEWLALVRDVRAFALKREILDVVATPRAVKFGAILLSQGMARSAVIERTLKRGALVEAWPDVLALPSVRAFLKGQA